MRNQKYLLDTNICIFFMRGKYELDEKFRSVGANNCYISSITVAELFYGAACSKKPAEEKKKISKLVSLLNVLRIDDCLEQYAESKAYLRNKGDLIDDFDLLIGATAIVHNMIAVTDNTKHLGKLPNIKLENWVER